MDDPSLRALLAKAEHERTGARRTGARAIWALAGAMLTALVWYLTTLLLPVALSLLTSYDLTYGSLAGVVVVLIFFFFVGLGVVIGAELNAALADFPELGEEKAVRDAIGRDD